MTLQERLKKLFPEQERGFQARIARACKVSGATVSNWLNLPQKVSTMNLAHAEAICAEFDLDIEPRWLADGTGPMVRSAGPATKASTDVSLPDALRALGRALAGADDLSRLQVGSLLEMWIHQPDRYDEIERRIIDLLRAPVTARRPKGSTTREEHQ